jgi:hypothetical protein
MPADVLKSVPSAELAVVQLTGLSAVGKLAQRIVDLPGNQFMALMHEHFADCRAKAPLLPGLILGGVQRRWRAGRRFRFS